ncbi:hypothetical protein O9G_001413 [Rozella allomycis CSF55]|uniref:Uncharacterized protein n=1 Tax=Rozella allomycis (strain CSF55) TaxID=988480 RepID=A0A075B2Z4_ROZAC|nr:hypothetical protein O9G_001413 [Rozella allomycis CSF55]|eukprot:EPZ36968.1 hypothetical protein O9G_001413 [Rozella allomycis CSF55]
MSSSQTKAEKVHHLLKYKDLVKERKSLKEEWKSVKEQSELNDALKRKIRKLEIATLSFEDQLINRTVKIFNGKKKPKVNKEKHAKLINAK